MDDASYDANDNELVVVIVVVVVVGRIIRHYYTLDATDIVVVVGTSLSKW